MLRGLPENNQCHAKQTGTQQERAIQALALPPVLPHLPLECHSLSQLPCLRGGCFYRRQSLTGVRDFVPLGTAKEQIEFVAAQIDQNSALFQKPVDRVVIVQDVAGVVCRTSVVAEAELCFIARCNGRRIAGSTRRRCFQRSWT